ncbi:LysR family transcriptional regulator [Rhodobacteraceae bacterium XHP0102]|nr:LysR family transcriptional regulator [Rhodobacteraceae bacterium XHP0102]
MLDYAALTAFAAVLRTGSFDGAAQILGVTQSAISQRVKALEERLGCHLVQRTRPARATDAGQRMLRHIDDVTLMEAQLIKDLGLMAPNISAHFRIAAPSEAINGFLLQALGQAEMQNFEIVQKNSDDVLDLLRRGEVNAGITSRPLSIAGVASFTLPPLDIVACASAAMTRTYPEAAILKAPRLVTAPKSSLPDIWAKAHFGPKVEGSGPARLMPSLGDCVIGAQAGLGWIAAPYEVVKGSIEAGDLVQIGGPKARAQKAFFWHMQNRLEEAFKPLITALRAEPA